MVLTSGACTAHMTFVLRTHHTHTLTTHHRKDFNGDYFNGKITTRIFEGLPSDAKPLYHVLYEDGDEEDLYAEEIVPLLVVRVSTPHTLLPSHLLLFAFLQDPERKRELVNAMNDIEKVMNEMKKDSGDRNEFLMSFADRSDDFFGKSLEERRKNCCSIHNYCIFSHNVGECQCDKGISPWQKATECKPYIFHHDKSCCKCDRIAMTIGQDESVFHAYILGK